MTRILVLGATGYTGRLTVAALVRDGARPTLLGRNADTLGELAEASGGLDTEVVDVADPAGLRGVVEKGDVLVTTVGPFLKYGRPAVQVAAEVGADYVDSTGEGPFIREVFDTWGPIAARNGSVLLPAMGFDYAPGALAGALALEAAGDGADSVDIAYFWHGFAASGGTQASSLRVMFEPSYAFRDGRIVHDRIARDIETFTVAGQTLIGASIPAAEQFGLPRSYPALRNVTVRLSFPESARLGLRVASPVLSTIARFPRAAHAIADLADRRGTESTGGPSSERRSGVTTTVIATATGPGGVRETVTLEGPDPYEVTADLIGWSARSLAAGDMTGVTGAVGPVEAFGLDALRDACAAAGLRQTS